MGRFLISILISSTIILLFMCVPWIGNPSRNLSPGPLLKSQSQFGSNHQDNQPRWLISTMSAVDSLARRDTIRNTWQALYASPVFETRFVIANYNDSWSYSIEQENRTYGDLVRLDNVEPGAKEAHTIKTMEYFKHIVAEAGSRGRCYDFVSKIDDDVFLVATKFFSDYLAPRLHPMPATRTLIARWMQKTRRHPWPQGSFYTLSWDMILLLAQSHTQSSLFDIPEDVMVGELLGREQVKYEFVKLDKKRAFDVAGPDTHPPGTVGKEAIAPHMLKDDKLYRQVASLFDESGWNGKSMVGITDTNWKGRLNIVDRSGKEENQA